MAKKVPLEKLQVNLEKILKEYSESVDKDLEKTTKKVTQQGVKALQQESASKFGGGRYAKGWTSQFERKRYMYQGTIYNKTPGLPHLLEKPHAKRNGGRTTGNPHIAPVEEKVIDAMEKAVKNDL